MKTYTKGEYLKFYNGSLFRELIDPIKREYMTSKTERKLYCLCPRSFGGNPLKAYKDCPYCMGIGILAIPWSEVM